MRRRMLILPLGLGLVGCAPAAAPPSSMPDRQITTITTEAGTAQVERFVDTRGSQHAIPFGVDRTWGALLEGYAALEIPLATLDESARLAGNRRFSRHRTLGRQRLSRYFACGATAGGIPIADSYRLQVSVVSTLQPLGEESTRLETHATATAIPHGTSSTPVQCSSTGLLEERLSRSVLLSLVTD